MTGPVLTLSLDRADATYASGEVIEGTVALRSDAAVECKRCSVGLRATFVPARAGITANHESGQVVVARLSSGEPLAAGEERRWRFRLEVPAAVRDYQGGLFHARYEVQADARAGGLLVARAPVRIQPRADPGPRVAWDAAALRDTHGALRGSVYGTLAAAALLAAAIYFESTWILAAAVGIGILGVITLFGNLKPWLAERRSGRLQVGLSTPEPGVLRVQLRAAALERLGPVTATLSVEEYVRRAAPDQKNREWRQPLYEHPGRLAPTPDGALAVQLDLPRPGQVPYPIEIGNRNTSPASAYAIDWRLRLSAEIPSWPDWTRELELKAGPSDVPAEADPPTDTR